MGMKYILEFLEDSAKGIKNSIHALNISQCFPVNRECLEFLEHFRTYNQVNYKQNLQVNILEHFRTLFSI